jgi:hypothetical protein
MLLQFIFVVTQKVVQVLNLKWGMYVFKPNYANRKAGLTGFTDTVYFFCAHNFMSIIQHGADIFLLEHRKFVQDLPCGHSLAQEIEDLLNRYPHSTDCGFTDQNSGINGNAAKKIIAMNRVGVVFCFSACRMSFIHKLFLVSLIR